MLNVGMDYVWLVTYIVIWAIIIWYYWKHKKYFGANLLILVSYLGYAIVSFFYYKISYPEYRGLHLYPFLFQILMIMIAMRPVTQYCNHRYSKIAVPNEKAIMLFLYVYAACSLILLLQSIPKMQSGLMMMLVNVEDAGRDIYEETMDRAGAIGDGTSILNLPQVFANVFQDVGLLLTFYYISRPKYNKWFAILLAITLLTPIFSSIALSQRGPAIDRLYAIAVTFFLVRPYLSEKIRKAVRVGALILLSVVFVFIASITYSRFGNQNDDYLEEQLYSYIGQENLNFNKYAFDNNGIRYGDRTAPMFKRMVGFSNVPRNFTERQKKYPYLKTDDYAFIGFVGDFCLDYGPLVSFVLFVFFSFFFCQKTYSRRKEIELHKLLLIQFAACVCMCGGMKLFSYNDLGNLKIIAFALAYFYIKYTTEQKRYSEVINENSDGMLESSK